MKERLNILGRDGLIKLLLNLPLCVQHLGEISEVARKQGVFHLQGQLFHTLQRFHNCRASVFVRFYLSLENAPRASCGSVKQRRLLYSSSFKVSRLIRRAFTMVASFLNSIRLKPPKVEAY